MDEAVTVAWANHNSMPAVLFAVLFALLLAFFGYSVIRRQAEFGLLVLAGASLTEMFYFLSLYEQSNITFWLRPLFLYLFLLLPMLYCAIRMKKGKKIFLPLLLLSWLIPFAASALDYTGTVPIWLLNTAPYLMFLPLAALLPLSHREHRAENSIFRLLMPGWYACLGILALLFLLSQTLHGLLPRFGSGSLLSWISYVGRGSAVLLPQPLLHLLGTLLLLLLFFTAALEQVKQSIQQEEELKLLTVKNDIAMESIHSLEQSQEALAVARHDQLHHLRVLMDLAQNSPEEAADYAASLIHDLSSVPSLSYTNNRLVNTILTAQTGKAKTNSVTFWAETILPKILPIPDKDLCAVLMNLLDNAVNAASQTPAGVERFVSVTLKTEEGYLLITIENTLPEGFDRDVFREKLYQISVSPEAVHGLGLRSVRIVLSRYGGELRFSIKGSTLILNTVMSLYGEEEKV